MSSFQDGMSQGQQFKKLATDVLAARSEANENARYLNTMRPLFSKYVLRFSYFCFLSVSPQIFIYAASLTHFPNNNATTVSCDAG